MSASDLTNLRKQCLSSLYACTDNITKYLDNERSAEYEKFKRFVKEYCLMESLEDVAIQALDKAKKEVDAATVDTLDEKFNSNLRRMADTQRNDERHPYMIEFSKHVQKGLEVLRNNIDDSDLAITESQNTYNDPITKKPIENPLKNIKCGHVYEQDVILKIISKKKMKCPVAGCGNREPIEKKHLVPDEELKFRMAITQHSTMIQDPVVYLDDTIN